MATIITVRNHIIIAYSDPSLLSLGKAQLIGSKLCTYKWHLWEGQAYDALHEMRHHLRLCTHCYKHKDRFSHGVQKNLQSQTTIKKLQVKVDHAARKYHAAWAALVSLSREINSEDWKARMKPLKELVAGDIHGLSDGLEESLRAREQQQQQQQQQQPPPRTTQNR
jgi:hypothetical protein